MSATAKWRATVRWAMGELRRNERHLSKVASQHRREIDELRRRLDAIEGRDTKGNRKLIEPPAPTPPPIASRNGSDAEAAARERVKGLWQGVWQKGTHYEAGVLVTHAGGLWFSREATAERPGAGPTSWVLALKSGKSTKLETSR